MGHETNTDSKIEIVPDDRSFHETHREVEIVQLIEACPFCDAPVEKHPQKDQVQYNCTNCDEWWLAERGE
jgi:hypothetical protein